MDFSYRAKTARIVVLFVILFASTASIVSSNSSYQKKIESTGSISDLPHVELTLDLNEVIGINNLSLGFQLDGRDIWSWKSRSQLRTLAEDANLKLIRFFPQRLDEPLKNFPDSWDWTQIDDLVTKIFAIGAEPIPVLGFCGSRGFSSPSSLPKDSSTSAPYPDDFATYCQEWMKHFKQENLPVRYYELINEPHHYFEWGGTNTERRNAFRDIFNAAAVAMRQENSDVLIGNDNSMVRSNSLNKWMAANLEPLDFLSWHRYLLPIGGQPTTDEFAIYVAENNEGVTYGYNVNNFIEGARQDYRAETGRWLPVIQSEGNLNYRYSGGTDQRIQEMLGAVTTALSIRMLILKGYVTHNIFFDFAGSEASPEKFGMVNLDDNAPWYPYYVHYMIGRNLAVGDAVVESSANIDSICVLAWLHGIDLKILVISKTHVQQNITVEGLAENLNFLKIDESYPWNNPQLLEGSIAPGESVTLNGYAVVLMSATL